MVESSDGNDYQSNSITQTIRSPEAIILIVINLKNDGGISDLQCEAGMNLHWKVKDHNVESIEVKVPNDFGNIVDTFEVLNGKITNMSDIRIEYKTEVLGIDLYGNELVGGSMKFPNVALSSSQSTRLFVLANSPSVRENIENNLKAK